MTTPARCFICVLAVPLAALLSCTARTPRRPRRTSIGGSTHTDFDAFANAPGGRANPIPPSSRAGADAPLPARRTGASCRAAPGALASRRLASGKQRTTPRRSLRVVHGRGTPRGSGSHAAGAVPRRHRFDPESGRPPAEHPASPCPGHSGRVRDRRSDGQPRARTLHRQRRRRWPGLVRPRQVPSERAALRASAPAVPGARRARPRAGGEAGRRGQGVLPRHSRARDAPRRGLSRPPHRPTPPRPTIG